MCRKLLPLLFCLLFATAAAQATVYYVDYNRPNNSGAGTSWATAKKDLQDAINLLAYIPGNDEVWVRGGGTYKPTRDLNGSTTPADPRDKAFALIGTRGKIYGGFAGTETASSQRNPALYPTVLSGDLDGPSGTQDAYHVVEIASAIGAPLTFDGFSITGGRAEGTTFFQLAATNAQVYRGNGGGIDCYFSPIPISNCKIYNNSATGTGGGMCLASTNATVTNCTFSNNTAVTGAGLGCGSSYATFNNCVFTNNSASNVGGGICLTTNSSPTFNSCVMRLKYRNQ